MNLRYNDKKNLLKLFPKIELSYQKRAYKKIQSDLYLSIPKGNKYFAWFTTFNGKDTCFFLQISNSRKSIVDIFIYTCCFNKILTIKKGTICYGTIFTYNKTKFFNTEDIFYYKGIDLTKKTQQTKFQYIFKMFKNDIKQIAFSKNDIVIALPIISKDFDNLHSKVSSLPYSIYSIQSRSLNKKRPFYNFSVKQTHIRTFLVQADTKTDIYHSFVKESHKICKHNVLFIDKYKTSVFMNRLFRRIRENECLDYIEESEDEDDFENINEDKFVDINKKLNIDCVYSYKYKLWIPIKESTNKISTKIDILNVEKNYN